MNYFDPKTAAERYAKGRPDFHSNTIQHIKDYLKIDHPLDKVLDIACGTGLSTKALLEIARHVYGTDSSREMLNYALQPDKIHYAIAFLNPGRHASLVYRHPDHTHRLAEKWKCLPDPE